MKFSIFSRFLVSLYLFISFTQLLAAPIIGYEQGLEVRARKKGSPPPGSSEPSGPSRPSNPKPKMEANAEKFVDWLETKGKQYNTICFYSGATGITPVWTKMSTFQVRFGCESFGSLLAKAGISQSDTGRWKDALEWTATSRALAELPAATPAKRARQRANRAARKAEDATNTDATATVTETLPVDDSLCDDTDHLTPNSSNIPTFISPDNVEHVATWKAAVAEAFERGLKAGIELAEKQMTERFTQLEDRERRNRRIALSAEGVGRESGVNEERARWLAIYPDTIFSEFNEETFPETVPLAAAAQPPQPITHDVATQATLPIPQMRLVLLPPSSPPTNKMSTQTDDFPAVTTHSVPLKTTAPMPISSISSPLPSPLPTQISKSTPVICRWSDESDDPYITAETIQHAPNLRPRDDERRQALLPDLVRAEKDVNGEFQPAGGDGAQDGENVPGLVGPFRAQIKQSLHDLGAPQADLIPKVDALVGLPARADELLGGLNGLAGSVDNLERSADNLERSFNNLERSVENLAGRINVLEGRVEELLVVANTTLRVVQGMNRVLPEVSRNAARAINFRAFDGAHIPFIPVPFLDGTNPASRNLPVYATYYGMIAADPSDDERQRFIIRAIGGVVN
ncbi:hypothetical protein H1R20_g12266, partial [Candolleomyces eurysporus]